MSATPLYARKFRNVIRSDYYYKNVTSRKQHEVEINIFLPTVSECDASLRCKVYKCHQTFEEDKNNNKVLQNQPMMTFLFLRIRMWNKSLSSRRISGGKVDLSVDQIQLLALKGFLAIFFVV